MSLAAPLRLPHSSLINIAQAIAGGGSVRTATPGGGSASDHPVTTAAETSTTVAAMDESPPASGHSEASPKARVLPLAATQLSRSGLNPLASSYPCSRPSLEATSAPVTPPSTPTPSIASAGGEDPDDALHSPSRGTEKEDCPDPEAEDSLSLGNNSLDFNKLGLADMSNDGDEPADVGAPSDQLLLPATAISQPVAFQAEQQQQKTPHQIVGLPDTPPQQSYLPGPCSPPSLTVDVSSVSSSFSVGGDRDSASPLESPVGRMPYALSVALTDAVVRNNTAELAAALSTGLSPDTSVAWYPPDSLTGAPIERSLVALAAYYGSRDAVAHLLALGADPNLPSAQDGMTSLHAAAAGGSMQTVEIIHLLLANGADRNALDSFGRIPVEVLVQQQKQANSAAAAAQQQQQQQLHQVPASLGQQWDDSFEDDGVMVGPHVPDPTGCSELSDINRPEYSTDEFRINCFKVLKCTKSRAHDWTECPFVHPGEKARRRSPQKFSYSSTACPDFRKGVCRRGDLCGFSHGVFECWLHPARYRTQMCKDGPLCTRRVCFFAHTVSELRAPAGPSFAGGCCSDGCSSSSAADLCGATYAYAMPPPGLQPSSAAPASPPSLQLQHLQLQLQQQQQQGQQMPLSGPFVPGMSTRDYQQQQQRRHSDIGEHSYSKSYSWPHQRRSMQGDEQLQQQQQRGLTFVEAPPSLNHQQQQQQQQQRFLLVQQQQQNQQQNQSSMSISSAYGSLSCPTSPLMSPLQSPPASSPSPAARPPVHRALWSPPPAPFPYKMAPQDDSRQQQQQQQGSPGAGPAPRWLQQVREAELLDSPNISRVGSLSALDVSWVDELTHAD